MDTISNNNSEIHELRAHGLTADELDLVSGGACDAYGRVIAADGVSGPSTINENRVLRIFLNSGNIVWGARSAGT